MEKRRLSTFKVQIPIQFTMLGYHDWDNKELYMAVIKEAYKRLTEGNPESGYIDVLGDEARVVNEVVHYTKEELEKQETDRKRMLAEIRGLR